MKMEKLQIIKEDYRIHPFGIVTSPENFNWLVEQAEKLEQLKKIMKD
jgi:ribosomal protein S15P/S13E